MAEFPSVIDARYRVDRRVGEGGFGVVYAGFHLALGVPVAIKVLNVAADPDPDRRTEHAARFLAEGRALTRLRHPNIVIALDLGFVASASGDVPAPYLVMEWVDGVTLQAALAARGTRLPLEEAWPFFEALLQALAHAHDAGVVHRDLKPSNVMVLPAAEGFGWPRVIDFGVAKLVAPDETAGSGTTQTVQSSSPFTPAYAAPEQIVQARTGPWTDVHALGLLFVELVTGAPPYGKPDEARLAAIDPARPTPAACGVDVGVFEEVVARALAIRPRERWANAREMLEAASAAARAMALPAHSVRPRSLPAPPARDVVPVEATTMPAQTERTESTGLPPRTIELEERPPPSLGVSRWSWRTYVLSAALGAAGAATAFFVGRAPSVPPSPAAVTQAPLEAGGLAWRVQAGSWRVEDGALVGSGGQVISTSTFADGTLEVDFEIVTRSRNVGAIGVGFRAIPAADPAEGSGYGANFAIGSGTFAIFRGIDGVWESVDPAFAGYHPSPAIRDGKNHIVVRAKGTAFEVDLNDQPIARFDDPTHPRGHVTLWVQARTQTVRFSGIRLAPQ